MTASKNDSSKAPLALIPTSALLEEAQVLAFGAEKYDTHNWRQGLPWSRLISAILRHVTAFNAGEDFDPETGLHHMAHARVSCGFLIEYMATHPELDDRYVPAHRPQQGYTQRQRLIDNEMLSTMLHNRPNNFEGNSKEPPWLLEPDHARKA